MIRVVDASVAAKWYLQEPFSEECLRLLKSGAPVAVPELIDAQVGHMLWQRVKTHQLSVVEAERILRNLKALPLKRVPIIDLAEDALAVASATTRTFDEALYLALALRNHTQLITADRTWFHLVRTGNTGPLVRFVVDAVREG